MEKLEHKLIIMREIHEEQQTRNNNNNNVIISNEHHQKNSTAESPTSDLLTGGATVGDGHLSTEQDPFYDSQENHNLIGVANIFLECLFSDVKLNYHVPIISQQAEVAGRLQASTLFISILCHVW